MNTDEIEEFAKSVDKKQIVIVGIGGSSLGTYAIYQFLKMKYNFSKELIFLESTDPILLLERVSKIDMDNALFIVISKSGTTVETVSIFKYLLSNKELSKDDFIFITDNDSPLENFANHYNLRVFNIPKSVGGRFSVLSAVGLLPLAILGCDIKKLLLVAAKIRDSFFLKKEFYELLLKKASFYAKQSNHYNINCIFSYSEIFRGFNDWYVQLWGESLGKRQNHSRLNVGLTPVGLIGPTDQHSFLQLIVEGKRDKSVTFIKIKDFENHLEIPKTKLKYLEKLDGINGVKFCELINMQADSIIESLLALNEIPVDVLVLEKVDEENIGKLIFYYELLTSLTGSMLDVNVYNQPGVEEGKTILKKKLVKH